jgi:hypothetical protein
VTGVVVEAAELDASFDPASDCVEVAVVVSVVVSVVVVVDEPPEALAVLELFAAVVSASLEEPARLVAAPLRCIVELVRAEPLATLRTSATVAATVAVAEPMLPSANTATHMVASRISAVAPTRRRSTCVRRRLARSSCTTSRAWR